MRSSVEIRAVGPVTFGSHRLRAQTGPRAWIRGGHEYARGAMGSGVGAAELRAGPVPPNVVPTAAGPTSSSTCWR